MEFVQTTDGRVWRIREAWNVYRRQTAEFGESRVAESEAWSVYRRQTAEFGESRVPESEAWSVYRRQTEEFGGLRVPEFEARSVHGTQTKAVDLPECRRFPASAHSRAVCPCCC